MKVIVPSALRSYTERAETEASGATLAEVLADLDRQYAGIRFRMIDEQDRIRRNIRIFVNGEQARDLARPLRATAARNRRGDHRPGAERRLRSLQAGPDHGEISMKYLLLCCFDEKRWAALPQIRRDAIMQEYGALLESLDRSGQHLATGKLRPVATAATVRSRDGRAVVSDGPFAETKEQLGGYHLLECRDADEAIAIAKRFPTLAEGGVVEVRALEYCTP